MTEDGAEELADALATMNKLRKIDVSGNNLKKGLNLILYALQECKPTLRELNISSNRSGNKAIKPLLRLIKESPHLQVLKISDLNLRK